MSDKLDDMGITGAAKAVALVLMAAGIAGQVWLAPKFVVWLFGPDAYKPALVAVLVSIAIVGITRTFVDSVRNPRPKR